MVRRHLAALVCAFATLCLAQSSPSFVDPPVFTSSNHLLDLLIIARASTIKLGSFTPTAWVYEICPMSVAQDDQCPSDSRTVAPYGGVRLQVYPGDHLRMRLVNHLPPAPADAENAHGDDPMMNEQLIANPTNIHTHGLIVEPRKADAADPTYGDFVYVLGYPSGKLPAMVDPDLTATDKPIQYDIYIPPNHPSGLFYFHPHVHGLGVNQISEGLSGMITIGNLSDYASATGNFNLPTSYMVHEFIIKDTQVLANGNVLDQEDSEFCAPTPAPRELRDGSCPGIDNSNNPGDPGSNYTGGRWFFSVNGRVDPTLQVNRQVGQVWRLLNSAASRSYSFIIQSETNHAPVLFQVVSLDGVALAPLPGTDVSKMGPSVGGKFNPVPCPGPKDPHRSAEPVCATQLVMLPSSRAEIWLSPHQAVKLSSADFITQAYSTGAAGDDWPAANLVHLVFSGTPSNAQDTLSVRPVRQNALSSTGILGGAVRAMFPGMTQSIPIADARQVAAGKKSALPVPLDSATSHQLDSLSPQQVRQFAPRLSALSRPVASIASPNCAALPPGYQRRIFFGIPSNNPDGFGLGYEEIDDKGNPVPGTFEDITAFNPEYINVCLPLAPNNQPVTEVWQLVNVAGEAHNFHMHQTKFLVLPDGAPAGDGGVLMDEVPLPNGGGTCDGTIATWRSGTCKVKPVYVAIPFSEVGDYVYHCHIGEHQDGGMMAHIRVISNP
ncbi:MAG TPA: multicopper oxidase domain-containing protein [Terracidiphilus sp.]|nr:multicopper oxidase domain-containing protein [Terracidiphilus sp.]